VLGPELKGHSELIYPEPELKGHSELIYPEPELKSDSEFFDPGFEPEFKGDSELRSESAFNISSGIDGLFDMEYNVNAGEVNVIVKLEINTDVEESEQEKDKANSLATLQEAADHWSDKFRFKSNRGEYVSVKIKAVEDKSFHYRFWPVTNSSQNPNVYRKQKLFMARTSADEKKKAQPSTMHEFGHAIGLGEEYNVETEKDKQGHHYRFASGKHKEEINAIETGEHSNIDASQGSIMGSSGKVLQPRHYTMILKQFELLRKKVVDDTAETWEIEEPSK
jgi:hypothetical protein